MGENANNDRMQQQSNDAQRQQVGQQNRQGERRPGEGQEGRDIQGEGDGLAGGVDTGTIQPGKTGDGGVER